MKQRLWEFVRGKPRLGGLSVTETEERRNTVRKEGSVRAQSTKLEAARRSHHNSGLKARGPELQVEGSGGEL